MEVTKKINGNNYCVTEFRANGVDRVWFDYEDDSVVVNIGPERLKFFASVDGKVMVKDGV